ncbi:MAG: hypothetical protein GXZ11_05660 [Tissierellia bacterium]|nr:hypothetical protein [Tissierellia bacterium]
MTDADILATTYYHTATVVRNQVARKGKFDDYELETVYDSLKCAVSFTQGSTEGLTDTVQSVNYTAVLFAMPDVVILPGDDIVADVYGREYFFIAGEGAVYESHIEVPLIRSDKA